MKKYNIKNLIFIFVMSLVIMASFVMPVYCDGDFKNYKENFSVKAIGSLFNLANGGIIENSEKVYLNNILMDKSQYSIDYGAAVLIINKLLNIGDRVDVDYCYIPNTPKTAITSLQKNFSTLNYVNGNTSSNMSLLYNSVDATTGDATYGTNFKTNFGSNFTIDSSYFKSFGQSGEGDFNLHKMSYNNAGLSINFGYQDSGDDFKGMNYATASGVDAGVVTEAGLKRTDFGLNYAFANNGLLKFNYNTVGDDEGSITNTDFAFNNSKLNFAYTTQDIGQMVSFDKLREGDKAILAAEKGIKRNSLSFGYDFGQKGGKLNYASNSIDDSVDTIKNTSLSYANAKLSFNYNKQNIGEFTRFDSLREADKGILAAEKGMDRVNYSLAYDFGIKGGKLNYSQNGIDYKENSILAKSLNYDSAKYKFSFYNRNVDSGFGNFNGLRDGDKGQIAAEAGINRTSNTLSFDIGKKDAANWQTVSTLSLKTEDGNELKSNTYTFNYNNIESQYFTLNIDNAFNRMNAMNGNERNEFSGFARKLFNYGQGVGNVDDADRNSWFGQNGINRDMKFLKYNLKDGNIIYTGQKLSLDSGAGLDTNRLSYAGKYKGKDISFYYNQDKIDEDFNRLGNLTNIERANYNNMYGMKNLNYGLEGTFGIGYVKYANNKISDTINDSGFSRSYLNYVLPKYNFTRIETKFDNAFTRIGDISDPNRGTYLQGFDKKEYTANMNFGSASKVFTVNSYFMNANHETENRNYKQKSATVNYVPDARFNMSYYSNDYKYEVDDNYAVDNKEMVIKMTKLLNIGKLQNNSFYTQYRTNSFLENNNPINQKFIDFSYKTDTGAKFILNLDYNISEFSETDKRKGYDLYATQMLTSNIGVTFGMGKTDYLNAEPENRIKYGVTYKINDTFNMAYNIDKVTKGNDKSRDNSSFVVSGKLPQFISKDILSDITANFKYDLNQSNDVRNLYNDNYSFTGKLFNGDFKIEKASILDADTKSWYNDSNTVSYKNNSLFGTKLSVEYLGQATTNTVTKILGQTQMYKFNYTLTDKLSTGYSLVKGQWHENNFIPVRSEEFSLTNKIGQDKDFSLKYSQARNAITNKNEKTWALAFTTNGSQKKGKFNLQAGISSVYDSVNSEERKTRLTYSLQYEYMLSKERFLSIVAAKTTEVHTQALDDILNDQTMGLDYRQSF